MQETYEYYLGVRFTKEQASTIYDLWVLAVEGKYDELEKREQQLIQDLEKYMDATGQKVSGQVAFDILQRNYQI